MNKLLQQKRYEEVISLADSLLVDNPDDCDSLFFKARALICLKDYIQARPVLTNCLAVSPQDRRTWITSKMQFVVSLAEFQTNLERNKAKLGFFEEDWYEKKILAHIKDLDAPEWPNGIFVYPGSS